MNAVEREPGRFVLRIGAEVAFLGYARRGDVLDLQHTWTPPALRGRDVAARLVAAAVEYARAEHLKILPTCSYVRRWLAQHPELGPLVADG